MVQIPLLAVLLVLFGCSLATTIVKRDTTCEKGGVTYQEGEVFVYHCKIYQCLSGNCAYQGGDCRRSDDTCVPVGNETLIGCSVYMCDLSLNSATNTYSYSFKMVSPRCSIGSVCYDVNVTVSCITCVHDGTDNYPTYDKECNYDGQCYAHGNTQTMNGCTHTCNTGLNPAIYELTDSTCSTDNPCTKNGVTYQHLQIFTSNCLTYKCENGQSIYQSGECGLNDGTCHAVGAIVVDGCNTRECTFVNSTFQFNTANPRCLINEECVDVGNSAHCVTCVLYSNGLLGYDYECEYNGGCDPEATQIVIDGCSFTCTTGSYTQDDATCSAENSCDIDGQTYVHGAYFQIGCYTYECMNGAQSYVSGDCSLGDGSCLPIGSETTYKCSDVACSFYNNSFHVEIVQPRCDSSSHGCMEINEQVQSNCHTLACSYTNGQLSVDVIQPRCLISGQCVDIGQTQDCITCIANSTGAAVAYACNYGGNCYANALTMTIGNCDYTCDANGQHAFIKDNENCTNEESCTVGSTTYLHGDTYLSGCFTYECNNGNGIYQSGKCSSGSSCVAVGASVENGCDTVTCHFGNNSFSWLTTTQRCNINGQCINVGASLNCLKCILNENNEIAYEYQCNVNNQCFDVGSTYTFGSCVEVCDANGTYNKVDPTCNNEKPCLIGTSSIPHGYSFTMSCKQYICLDAQQYFQSGKCQASDGTCVDIGSTTSIGECSTQQCNNETSWEIVTLKCGYGGVCYPENTVATINSCAYTCGVSSSVIGFHKDDEACGTSGGGGGGGATCVVGDNTYDHNEIYVKDCFTYKCINGAESYQSGKCNYGGTCVAEDVIMNAGCSEIQCALINNMFQFIMLTPKCSINNVCVAMNGTQGCSTCIDGPGFFPAVKTKCSIGGVCYDIGEQDEFCNSCVADSNGLPTVAGRCQHSGICYDEGAQLTIGTCVKTCQVGSVIGFTTCP